jgi:hypothetical protein
MARSFLLLCLGGLALATASGCKDKPKRFDTRVEIVSARTMGGGQGKGAPSLIELEMTFPDCPGEVRRLVRGDKALAACAGGIKKGETLPATMELSYDAERENYRGDLVKLGPCDVKLDPKDDANYESFQVCKDVMASGVAVGIRCDKKREGDLIAKCPWLKRL